MLESRFLSPGDARAPLVRAAHRVLPPSRHRFEKAESWAAAQRASIGYRNLPRALPRIPAPHLSMQRELTDAQLVFLTQFSVAAGGLAGSSLRVLDVGGFAGQYWALAKSVFPRLELHWTILETPEVADFYLREVVDGGPRWIADLRHADIAYDVVVASASLNYLPEPIAFTRSLCRRTQWLLCSRLPLWPLSGHTPAVQRRRFGSKFSMYPTWFFSEGLFLSELTRYGTVMMDCDVGSDRAFFQGTYRAYRSLLLQVEGSSHG